MPDLTTNATRCVARICGPGMYGSFNKHQCSKSAQAGKKYCKAHDPAIRDAKLKVKMDVSSALCAKDDVLQSCFPTELRASINHVNGVPDSFKFTLVLNEKQIRRLATLLPVHLGSLLMD